MGVCLHQRLLVSRKNPVAAHILYLHSIGTLSRKVDQTWSILYHRGNSDCGGHGNSFWRFCICIKQTDKKPNSWCTFVCQHICYCDHYDQWKTLPLHMKCTHLFFLYKWVPLYSKTFSVKSSHQMLSGKNTRINLYPFCKVELKKWKRHYAMS